MSGLEPNRGISTGASRDTANSAPVMGRNDSPAWSGVSPSTSWTNWVRKKNIPNMPATSSRRTTNEAERLRSVNRRSGVIGCAVRVSIMMKDASSTTAAANAASVIRSLQPLDEALMNP